MFYSALQFLFKKEPRYRSSNDAYDMKCKNTKCLFTSRRDKRLGASTGSVWQQIFYRVDARA